VVSNAVLQWVPGHEDLLTGWVAALPPGAWLAVQVPGNFDAPSHRAMRAVAAEPAWRDLPPEAVGPREVPDAAAYARLLTGAGCAVDAWETTYLHLLPAGDGGPREERSEAESRSAGERHRGHPVLRWMEGTALRPVRAALGDGADWATFRAALDQRLAAAYPVIGDLVYFPFRRIFVVARLAGGAQ
jgi:trans-aconitate 2-methyltransferase